ncbi:hypothetical protein H4R19_001646 [Coemansia spiralis]|nr:hypothetical protein H4R19_001646 [Coemansia spiralis]
MSATHAYFLVDTGAVADGEAVLRAVTRILVFLASKHDAFTWNYEVADLGAQPRALTAHGRRRVCERKQVSTEALEGFGRALNGRPRRPKECLAGGPSAQRAVLDTVRRRLMCLEADVEWGDPALMRSPTKASAAGRGWTDPTRLNESMSVRSHLYIVSGCPGTPAEAEAFVYGPQPCAEGEERPLLDTLTRLRDGIIGNGVWENYARKRVGVSWIRPSRRPRLGDMDAVDVLVDAVFGCCVEALGGCVMDVPSLDCEPWLPFSALFAPLHRTRTHPGWSRKLSRELSAVVDRLAAPSAQPHGSMAAAERERRSWSIRWEGAGLADGASEAVLVEAAGAGQRWLADSRLMRRYNLPEMVALAGEAKAARLRSPAQEETGAMVLECAHWLALSSWPRAIRTLAREPVICRVYGDGNLFGQRFMVARQPCCTTKGVDAGAPYAIAAPVGAGDLVVLYPASAGEYAQLLATLTPDPEAETAAAADGIGTPFSASWLEGWAQRMEHPPLDISPTEHCMLDVSTREDLIRDYWSAAMEVAEPGPDLPSPEAASGASHEEHTEERASEEAVGHVSTLGEWYAEMYLKALAQQRAQLGHSAATLAQLLDGAGAVVERVAELVLQTSAAIEGAFEAASGDEGDESFAAQRRQCAARVADDPECRRRWQLQECQLQILIHLVVADSIRRSGAEDCNERVEQLSESLFDLADQLCIWASVDDRIGTFAGAVTDGGTALSADAEYLDGASDLAVAFIGSPAVSQFSEQLGEIVDELRMQCGWVPPGADADAALAADADMHPAGRRRKGTPRKLGAEARERSEVIVGQGRARAQSISGRRLARHLEELAGGTRARQRLRSTGPSENTATRNSSSSSNCSGGAESLPRRPMQLKLPPHLVQQLKNEVVHTARPAPLSRAHTINGHGPSMRGGGLGKRPTGAFGASSSARARPPRRKPIPEFCDPRSSPSLSGQVQDMHLTQDTQATKRQRTGRPVAAMCNFGPSAFIPISQQQQQQPTTFIYDSDDSDGGFEHSPVFSRVMRRSAQVLCDPAAQRALRFPGDEDD